MKEEFLPFLEEDWDNVIYVGDTSEFDDAQFAADMARHFPDSEYELVRAVQRVATANRQVYLATNDTRLAAFVKLKSMNNDDFYRF